MGRPESKSKFAALVRIRECVAEFGEEAGMRLARASFSSMPKGTWSKWCSQIRAEDARLAESAPVQAAAVPSQHEPAAAPAQAAAAPVQHPAGVPVQAVASAPTEAAFVVEDGMIDFFGELAIMLADCNLVRAYSAPVDPSSGARKLRNPVMLISATKLRATILALAQRHAESARNLEVVRQQHEELVQTIGGALKSAGDRELTETVLRDMQALADRWQSRERYLGRPADMEAAL